MNLYLTGHDCRYAAEQSLLSWLPGRKPKYPEGPPAGDRAELSMRRGATFTTCICKLTIGGESHTGRAAVKNDALVDAVVTERLKNRIVKLAFYRAALHAGLPAREWGSLTGVRPAKLLSAYLEQGLQARSAVSAFRRDYGVSAERAALCLDAATAALDIKRDLGPRDVCLYVGIPFCPTRCAYCSFVSQSVEKSFYMIEPFLEALHADIAATAAAVRETGLSVRALYIGGGTPTTLSPSQLDALLGALYEKFDLPAGLECTVEAGRPDTITPEKLRVLRDNGVGRISVNPQTMRDSVLDAIGRKHSAADIVDALETVRAVGGFAVNMDLIAGLPTDTPEGFHETMEAVLALRPENITVHTLAMKKGSRLTREGGGLPPEAEVGEMLGISRGRLSAEGYTPYYLYRQKYTAGGLENIGWARPGQYNMYNICIMEELCGIISMGAGGSTKLVGEKGRISRFFAPKYPREYIDGGEGVLRGKLKIKEFYHGL